VCSRVTTKALGRKGRPQPRSRQPSRPLQHDHLGEGGAPPQSLPVAGAPRRPSAIGSLPWQPERRSRKSPPSAKGLVRTMSGSSLPGTSARAASKSAAGNSSPRSRRLRREAPADPKGAAKGGSSGSDRRAQRLDDTDVGVLLQQMGWRSRAAACGDTRFLIPAARAAARTARQPAL
jgi:hypothetical protein